MNLHEYQAKDLFRRYNIVTTEGGQIADTAAGARAAAEAKGGDMWVVKAQVHAGGRGKAGGVKLARSLDEVEAAAEGMLGSHLKTIQTIGEGLPINLVLIEGGVDIQSELYLSALVDRASERVTFMASAAGGMDIEAVAEATPEKIFTTVIDPATGVMPSHIRKLGYGLGLNKEQIKQLEPVISGIYALFMQEDASLVEVNPLIVTGTGDLLALDAKINLDSNAMYRHPDLEAMRDLSQEDPVEVEASEYDLNYITLDGDIACMVNGAGLAMATMDLIKLHGGEPANFLDVGGGATAERVTAAFKLILSGSHVKAILVNIFGGIVRCDLIAEGIIAAVKEIGVEVPVIARLQGTNVEAGRKMLEDSGFDIIPADDLTDAAQKAVAAAA